MRKDLCRNRDQSSESELKAQPDAPQVSVVIAAYNPGHYLKLAVRSVMAQTWTNWELIIVDDGSQEDICASLPDDTRIKCVRQKNQGAAAARNLGIMHARANLIAFLDSDDLWLEEKLERQVAAMSQRLDVGLCHTRFQILNSNNGSLCEGYEGCNIDYLDLMTGCGICLSTSMVRKENLFTAGLFQQMHGFSEDWDLWLRLAPHTQTLRVEHVLAQYRIHEGNKSRNYLKLHQTRTTILRNHVELAKANGDVRALQAARRGLRRIDELQGGKAFDAARASFHRRDWIHFARHLRDAFQMAPIYTTRGVVGKLGRRK